MAAAITEMKKAFSEALAPYGFTKVKGRYPYFVKLVAGEILEVITIVTEAGCSPQLGKLYDIRCGIGTVYGSELDLRRTPKENSNSLHLNYWNIYNRMYRHMEEKPEEPRYPLYFPVKEESTLSYKGGNALYNFAANTCTSSDNTWEETIEYGIDMTKQYILPILDKVTDIKSCRDYFHMYDRRRLNLYSQWIHRNDEGLLELLVFDNIAEYEKGEREDRKANDKEVLYLMETGAWSFSKEDYEKDKIFKEKCMLEQIHAFDLLLNDSEIHAEALAEMEQRKKKNMEILQEFGFDF